MKWIRLAVLMGLVLTACSERGGDSTAHTDSEPPDRSTATVTTSPPSAGAAACSAAGAAAGLEHQPGLPNPVEEVRQAIADAAVDCEFRRLAALARADGRFTFSFGDADDPAQSWRRQEKAGDEPMRFLVGVLDRPYGQVSAGDLVVFVWPSAATYDSWADVPPEARQALRPLYRDQDFEQFAEFGSYIGYRVGISQSGDWLYFVAGD